MEALIKIRFNTECKDGVSYWRAIINGVEHQLKEIVINNRCRTTKDWVEEKQDYKWHITVKSNNYTLHNGILTIN